MQLYFPLLAFYLLACIIVAMVANHKLPYMKNLLFFFLVPTICIAQEPVKFSNAIIVKGCSFQKIKSVLLERSFFIAEQNEHDGTITTEEKNVDKYRALGSNLNRYHVILHVRVKDDIATLTGQVLFTGQLPKEWRPIEYWKSKGSVPHYLFSIMDSVAHAAGNFVSYAKE